MKGLSELTPPAKKNHDSAKGAEIFLAFTIDLEGNLCPPHNLIDPPAWGVNYWEVMVLHGHGCYLKHFLEYTH